jgi:hypothetical protein
MWVREMERKSVESIKSGKIDFYVAIVQLRINGHEIGLTNVDFEDKAGNATELA